jgi:hypothetical protein
MFDLETQIANWRSQMLAAGIENPGVLDELEGHLREEMHSQLQAGWDEPTAFGVAVRQVGLAETLKAEFSRGGETIYERSKKLFHAFTGIPYYQLATNMNTSITNLEPRWTTYLKSAAFIVPAIVVWVGFLVFVMPKLKEVCIQSNTTLPGPVSMALSLSDLFKQYFIVGSVVVLAGLAFLEWRSARWPRYRRMVFGSLAFALNLFVLVMLAIVCVIAVIAAANLLHPTAAY